VLLLSVFTVVFYLLVGLAMVQSSQLLRHKT
jgi:hypothetical protein